MKTKIYEDDRTPEQKQSHTVLIAGTDSFMSGWGMAEGGASMCAWACRPEHASKVERWVRSRGDMKQVRQVSDPWRPNAAHTHIYVVPDPTPEYRHPALD